MNKQSFSADAHNPKAATLDQQSLDSIRSLQHPGKESILKKVLMQYLELSPALIVAINKQHSIQLRDAVHRLKSCSANIGATKLATYCQVLEEQIAHNEKKESTELVFQINSAYNRTIKAIHKELNKLNY